jgi:hypothetical protein
LTGKARALFHAPQRGGTEAMDGYFNTKFITQTGV